MPSIPLRVMIPDEKHQKLVVTVLMEFQWLEESLKRYLLRTELLIQERVKGDFRYQPSTKTNCKLPLGKLLVLFEKHCGNTALVGRIKALIEDRNYVAHASFVLHFNKKNELSADEDLAERLRKIELDLRGLPDAVNLETRQVEEKAPQLFGFSALITPK
jgi:hypothetical protein